MTVDCILDRSQAVARWVAERVPYVEAGFGPCSAIGIERDGELIAGVAYYLWQPRLATIHVAIAASRPYWASRRTLRVLFGYPFQGLGCERLTAMVASTNQRSLKLMASLGFIAEGRLRKGFGREDALVFGMLKDECRWIKSVASDQWPLTSGRPPSTDHRPLNLEVRSHELVEA